MRRTLGLVGLGIAAGVFLLLPYLARGQTVTSKGDTGWICGPNGCIKLQEGYAWNEAHGGSELHLRYYGKLLGTYVKTDKLYYAWSYPANAWSWTPSEPPVRLPPGFWLANPSKRGDTKKDAAEKADEEKPSRPLVTALDEPAKPTGVVRNKLHVSPIYSFKGKAVGRGEGHNLVEGKQSPSSLGDDSAKDRLTVISADPAKRQQFMAQFATDAAYAMYRARVLPWEAAPTGDWSVEPSFVKKEGEVYLTKADGEVIARAEVGDVADPQRVVGGLRKANPDYDPLRDPTPNGGVLPLELSRLLDFNLQSLNILQVAVMLLVLFGVVMAAKKLGK